MFDLGEFVKESNDIEGIYGFTQTDLEAHEQFLNLEQIIVGDLEHFVTMVQPGAKLRAKGGMDVRVGSHQPIPGGLHVIKLLELFLKSLNSEYLESSLGPYFAYAGYELLHPFMDGNGRSGRVIWLWVMAKQGRIRSHTSFLKQWHYQTLDAARLPMGIKEND